MKHLNSNICIAIIFPGDMGTAIARELIKKNFRVISASEGRSEKTLENIKKVGIEDVHSLEKLVQEADYIFSLTNSKASTDVAKEITKLTEYKSTKTVYVDLNSNNPETALNIQKTIEKGQTLFVNGAVLGNTENIAENGTIVVSGKYAEEIFLLLSGTFKVKNLGESIETASAYKLLFSMVNKSINGLFFETMLGAAHFGFLEELNQELQNFLPGTYEDLKKTTSTYPQHIVRRIDEMQELENMLKSHNLSHNYAHSSKMIFNKVAKSGILNDKHPSSVSEVFQYFKTKS